MPYTISMNTAETALPVEPSSTDLKSKTLLVISSPQPKKKFIYNRLKELGPKIILLAAEENWVSKLADGFLQADPLDEVACAAKVEELVKTTKVDGVITFWENAVPLAAMLAERFGWIGHTQKAALNAAKLGSSVTDAILKRSVTAKNCASPANSAR